MPNTAFASLRIMDSSSASPSRERGHVPPGKQRQAWEPMESMVSRIAWSSILH